MRILLVDPINSGENHAAFNATIVIALSHHLDVKSIYLFLEERQLETRFFMDIFQDAKVTTCSFSKDTDFAKVGREGIGRFQYLQNYRRFLKIVDDLKPDVIILLSADNLMIPLTLISLILIRKKIPKIFVIWHNNLENLINGCILLKKFIWRKATNATGSVIIVLSPFLKVAGEKLIQDINFRVLPHPTYAHLHKQLIMRKKSQTIKSVDFLFIGRHARDSIISGFLEEFLESCSSIISKIPKKYISVALPREFYTCVKDDVILFPYDSNPSFSEYSFLIRKAKFVVAPPCSGSRLTASGVLADLLTLGTPVIAPNEGVWKWQTAPKNRDFLFGNREELRQIILRALTLSVEEYRMLSLDILEYSGLFDIENTSKNLLALIQP